jgi:hypothetical protein
MQPRFASRLPSMARRRCFLPTSATDSRHEHPWIARLPGTQLALRRPQDASPTRRSRFFRAAPDHLAAIQPRLGTRLTARLQLRPAAHGSLCLSALWMPSTALRRRHPWLGVVDHAQSWRTTSDTPCRAPQGHPVTRMTLVRSQDRFRRPFVNEGDFPDPERLPSTSAPEKSRSRNPSCLGEPATDLAALPPAIRLPTLFHPSSALAQKS